jgi:2-octaprenyl-6-methoxyphenol hydroxylase
MNDPATPVVVGAGPVGLATALALDAEGLPSTLVAGRQTPADDGRAAAILADGLAFLDRAGAGSAIRAAGAPLAAIRIVDATGRLFRAPTVLFRASDIGEAAFGTSVLTAEIVRALAGEVARRPGIRRIDANVVSAARSDGVLALTLDSGETLQAPLAIAADGRRSLLREAAGIKARTWSYDQSALTFAVGHARDHEDISTEFHTDEGPFTLVPAGDRVSTVVWMMRPERATRLAAAGAATLAQEAERACRSLLGKLTVSSPVGHYPMGGLSVDRMVSGPVLLVGETAHAFPPIGAQGLNLGLRDARDAVALVAHFRDRAGAIAGSPEAAAFDRNRRRDAAVTTAGVDTLNRALLSSLVPAHAARGLAMAALGALPPLRRAAMALGMGRRPSLSTLSGS